MIVGCYDLRLDCDGTDEKVGCLNGERAHEFRSQSFVGDETGSRARARARGAERERARLAARLKRAGLL